jgi:hypothetical protein
MLDSSRMPITIAKTIDYLAAIAISNRVSGTIKAPEP